MINQKEHWHLFPNIYTKPDSVSLVIVNAWLRGVGAWIQQPKRSKQVLIPNAPLRRFLRPLFPPRKKQPPGPSTRHCLFPMAAPLWVSTTMRHSMTWRVRIRGVYNPGAKNQRSILNLMDTGFIVEPALRLSEQASPCCHEKLQAQEARDTSQSVLPTGRLGVRLQPLSTFQSRDRHRARGNKERTWWEDLSISVVTSWPIAPRLMGEKYSLVTRNGLLGRFEEWQINFTFW